MANCEVHSEKVEKKMKRLKFFDPEEPNSLFEILVDEKGDVHNWKRLKP